MPLPCGFIRAKALTAAGHGKSSAAGGLQRAGRFQDAFGRYILHGNEMEIRPSSESYFVGKNRLVLDFSGNDVQKIRSMDTGAALDSAEVEPELLTSLFDTTREKRRAISYNDIPKVLRDAVLSVEDRRFFEHPGFDPIRILVSSVERICAMARVQDETGDHFGTCNR